MRESRSRRFNAVETGSRAASSFSDKSPESETVAIPVSISPSPRLYVRTSSYIVRRWDATVNVANRALSGLPERRLDPARLQHVSQYHFDRALAQAIEGSLRG